MRRRTACGNPGCERNMVQTGKGKRAAGEPHVDQKANVDDWKIEHGFVTIDQTTRKERALDIPFQECFR